MKPSLVCLSSLLVKQTFFFFFFHKNNINLWILTLETLVTNVDNVILISQNLFFLDISTTIAVTTTTTKTKIVTRTTRSRPWTWPRLWPRSWTWPRSRSILWPGPRNTICSSNTILLTLEITLLPLLMMMMIRMIAKIISTIWVLSIWRRYRCND